MKLCSPSSHRLLLPEFTADEERPDLDASLAFCCARCDYGYLVDLDTAEAHLQRLLKQAWRRWVGFR